MNNLIIAMIVGVFAIEISVAIIVGFQALAKRGVKFLENQVTRMIIAFGIGFVLFLIAMGIIL